MRSFEVAESAEALSLVYRGLFLSNEGWGGGWGGGGGGCGRKESALEMMGRGKRSTLLLRGRAGDPRSVR